MKRGGQGRDRTGDLPLFRRTLVPTELPGRTARSSTGVEGTTPRRLATLTGLEPATSAVTGRRANQLRHRALLCDSLTVVARTPNGIRTRATAVKGRRPRPLDDGGPIRISPGYSRRIRVGSFDSLGYRPPIPQTGPGHRSGTVGPASAKYRIAPRPYSSVGRATDF